MNKRLFVTLIPVGIGVNIVGGLLAQTLKLPIFLDSIGTMLTAVILGPWLGALTGLLSNLLQGLFTDPINIPFGLVNAVIGLVVGFLALKRGFEDYVTPLIAGLILSVLAPIIGTPIAVYLFGGVTGGGVDLIYTVLLKAGNEIFASAFLARVPANLVDKLISAYLIMAIVRKLPVAMKGYAVPGAKRTEKITA
ncbi:CD3073 family putative ECF transporter S component [Candidatus Formimonas warabiya]|nr:CD3073 family putative ECF transporter S component [Candidatus Formimonas warabiya]